jgi:hypothetical protein
MENFNLVFPISMVKREERIVVGIATADNVDKTGDIVDFNASVEAFKDWAGNIREMHAPIAVGRAVDYEPVIIKGDDGQEYNAIKVSAYISKGAQDTWEKVLDGTLRGFSIGGKIIQKEIDTKKMFRGRPVSVIKKYVLGELSLVDNPANQNAAIDIIKRSDDGNLDYILKIACGDIDLSIPESVQRMAEVGLKQRREHGRGGTSVGLGSARRLAAGGNASPEFVRKVARYFPRHAVDLRATGADPGEDGYPSNGRIAWNLWGGTPGWVWARSKVRQLDNCTKGLDFDDAFEKTCSCGCGTCNDYDMIKELESLKESLDDTELLMILEMLESENDINLQNDVNYDTVNNMDSSVENKLSLMKRFINWLIPDEEVSKSEETDIIASTETVEAENDTKEDEYMDIDILKEALGTVIDQRLTDFAASIKEEVDASVTTKINELAKGFEDKSAELAEKLASAEKALAEQTEKVEAYASAGAIKKSVDPEDEDDAEELSKSESKSFWGNVYLPEALVKSLGYKS